MPTYTADQQEAMDKKAADAAKKEFDNDPLVKNALSAKPNHELQQTQVNQAIHELRKTWGLEK